ncbi:hypothetical protein ACN42_g11572 [Penicillium freii]|uniref:Uncharacterized protein n=1 Tax=Penicillium freii TaxID=48697 RepID=A0A101M817_PENFR|nr:hypothetical protein ACN42_g11572 [Penicillium freii]
MLTAEPGTGILQTRCMDVPTYCSGEPCPPQAKETIVGRPTEFQGSSYDDTANRIWHGYQKITWSGTSRGLAYPWNLETVERPQSSPI